MKRLLAVAIFSLVCSAVTQTATQLSVAATDRERDGLSGPVKAVLTDYVAFGTKDGLWSEIQQISSITIYDESGSRKVKTPFRLKTPDGYSIIGYDAMYNRLRQGETVEEEMPSFVGSPTGKWVNSWDSRGRLRERTTYTVQGVLAEKITVSYADDAHGNWTKRVVTPAGESSKADAHPREVCYRLLVYYKSTADSTSSTPVAPIPASALQAKSPLIPSVKNISDGQALYSQRCAACHGENGKADTEFGRVLAVKPTDLTGDSSRKLADGGMWWIVTHGITASRMPALRERLSENERWQIVLYVRALQGIYPMPPPLGLPAESRTKPTQRAVAGQQPASTPSEPKRYKLKGKILSVDGKLHSVTVEHEAIEGYMGAMTMPFPLKDTRLSESLKPGDLIQATLVVDEGRWWLESVIVNDKK